MKTKTPSVKLTFIISDTSPFIHMQEPIRKRSVQILLTPSQLDKLRLRYTGINNGKETYEEISEVFVEPGDK